jgi:hypothetical protein
MASDFRPGKLDIQMWRNDTWQQVFTLLADTTPISLLGATVYIQVRKGCGGVLALTLTNGSGVTIGGVSNNQITVNKLVDIAKGNYVWDMQVTFTSNVVKTYLEGDFIVYDDVTKP